MTRTTRIRTLVRIAILTAVVTGGTSKTRTRGGTAAAGEPTAECTVEVLASEPDLGPGEPEARRYPVCSRHDACCQQTKMRHIRDAPNKSRCASCLDYCNTDEQQGRWPYHTPFGGDCVYWAARYRDGDMDEECQDLPR